MNEKYQNDSPITLPKQSEKRIVNKKFLCLTLLSLAGLLVVVIILYQTRPSTYDLADTPSAETSAGNLIVQNLADNQSTIAQEDIALTAQHYDVVDVVKIVSQSVVSINITLPGRNESAIGADASGSGIIFSEDAENIYIITNNHVVQDAAKVTISIDDDLEAIAHYTGSNPQSDLAVVSVAKKELVNTGIENYTVAMLGDSDNVEVGEYVVAIGNALGEGKTVTDGIISAKNKVINLENTSITVLQTNAAINQGNSGGPLVNMDGEIIGINTAKLSKAGVEGMGYSIPINDAKNIFDTIMQNQSLPSNNLTDKPQLGIQGITITYDTMNQYRFPSQGVYIVETATGGSAANAGLLSEDIIIGFESARITTIEELNAELEKCAIGDTVKIYIYRNGYSSPQLILTTILGAEGINQF